MERTGKFRRYAQFFAVFGDGAAVPGLPLWELTLREYALFRRELAANADRLALCRTGAEAEAAYARGKTAAFLSVEGAELLDCDLHKLEEAYAMGVRAVNLTWNHSNALSGSNAEETGRGGCPGRGGPSSSGWRTWGCWWMCPTCPTRASGMWRSCAPAPFLPVIPTPEPYFPRGET